MTKRKVLLGLMVLGLLVGGTSSALSIQMASADESSTQNQTADSHERFMESVNRTVENIDDGIVITLTSDDPDMVKKLQEGPAHPPQMEEPEDITKIVENLDNGVQITITSTDPDTVTKLQEHPFGDMHHKGPMQGPMMENVERTVEKIDNGVVITLTSDDPETVQMLQDHAEGGFGPDAAEQEEMDE